MAGSTTPVIRTRKSTAELLGSLYIKDVKEIRFHKYSSTDYPLGAQPLESLFELRIRLYNADCVLRHPNRKLVPEGERCFQTYKNAVCSLIDFDFLTSGWDQSTIDSFYQSCLRYIQQFDILLDAKKSCLIPAKSAEESELQDDILWFARWLFNQRYPAGVPHQWKKERYRDWIDIAQRIRTERSKIDMKEAKLRRKIERPFLNSLKVIVDRIGLSHLNLLETLERYWGDDNKKPHASLEVLFKDGQLRDLRILLQNDLESVPLLINLPKKHPTFKELRNPVLESIAHYFPKEDLDLAPERVCTVATAIANVDAETSEKCRARAVRELFNLVIYNDLLHTYEDAPRKSPRANRYTHIGSSLTIAPRRDGPLPLRGPGSLAALEQIAARTDKPQACQERQEMVLPPPIPGSSTNYVDVE